MMSARSLFSRTPFRGPIQRSSRLVCLALFVVSVGTVGAHAAETAVSGLAEEILELAGSKIGLCVHLGCGRQETAALTAELAAASRMLVHGVAVDDASCDRARRAISERKLWGQATAERLPLRPLPHLDNLANLVVIEGFDGLAQQGLTWDEVQRIVAPGGRVCLKKDGRNDVLTITDDKLTWRHVQIEPENGQLTGAGKRGAGGGLEGLYDGTWTRLGKRRSGNRHFGRVTAEMFVWNESMLFGHESLVCWNANNQPTGRPRFP